MNRLVTPCLWAFVLAGCKPPTETPEQCRSACEHVASLNRPLIEESLKTYAHEQGEILEAAEAEAKKNLARLEKELVLSRPPFEKTLDGQRKVPAKTKRVLREQYRRAGEELHRQREAAIAATQKQITDGDARIAKMSQGFDANLKRQVEADAKKCSDSCVQGAATTKSTDCMLHAQAADQVPPCLGKSPAKNN